MQTQYYDSISWRGTTVPLFHQKDWYVYLLHFDTPYKHAKHYLGSTGCLDARLTRHTSGNGARLIEVISEHGISFQLCRLWPCENGAEARALEKRLKRRHEGPRLCPLCQGREVDEHVFMRQGHRHFTHVQARPRRPLPVTRNRPMC